MTNIRSKLRGITASVLAITLFACGGGGGDSSGDNGGGGGGETVVNPGLPPTANAGTGASYNGGEIAMLDGTVSTDPDSDPLRYTWVQTGGTNTVLLSDRHAVRPVFEVPNANDTYTFALTVNDGYDTSAVSMVTVTAAVYSGATVTPLTATPFRGSFGISGVGQDFVISGGTLYLPVGTNGLRIVDSSDPVALAQTGSMTIEDAHDVTVIGNFAYHVYWNSTFKTSSIYVTNVTNPASPFLYGQVAAFDSPSFARLTSVGNVLYAAGGDSSGTPSLRVYEITNTANPVGATDFKISQVLPATPLDVEVAGNYAYVADGGAGLRIIDVSLATAVTPTIGETGSFDTAGNAVNVAIGENYAYVADGMNGLVIVDVSDPASPSLTATVPVPAGAYYGTLTTAVSGTRAYVGTDFDIMVYDVTAPASPVLIGQYRAGNLIRKVRVSGDYLYVTDSQGLRTIPIGTVSMPRGTALYTAPDDITEMVAYGDLGFVRMQHQLDILDLRNGAASHLGTYGSAGSLWVNGMAIVDNYAYLSIWENGYKLALLRFRDPSAPAVAKTLVQADGGQDIVTDDRYIYVYHNANPSASINIYDVSNPFSPSAKGSLPSPYNSSNWLRSMAVRDSKLYLTEMNTSGTFRVADVSNPNAPSLLGGLSTVDLYGIAFLRDYVVTVGNNTGVRVLDVSDPGSPVYAGSGYPQHGYSISTAGSRAYVNSDFVGGGVKVINLEDPLAPSLAGEIAPSGGADHPVAVGRTLYSFYNHRELYRNEAAPMLNTRYATGGTDTTLSYAVSWVDDTGGNDHQVKCWVTGGSCSVGSIDQAANTVTVSWTLPGTAGDQEIMIAVGNGHYFGTTKDRVRVQ